MIQLTQTPLLTITLSLIVECKNEKIEPKNNKDGVEQLKSYMSALNRPGFAGDSIS